MFAFFLFFVYKDNWYIFVLNLKTNVMRLIKLTSPELIEEFFGGTDKISVGVTESSKIVFVNEEGEHKTVIVGDEGCSLIVNKGIVSVGEPTSKSFNVAKIKKEVADKKQKEVSVSEKKSKKKK